MYVQELQKEISETRKTLTAEIIGLQRQLTVKQQNGTSTNKEINEINMKLSALGSRVNKLQQLIGKLNQRLVFYKSSNDKLKACIENNCQSVQETVSSNNDDNDEIKQKYQELVTKAFQLIIDDKESIHFEMESVQYQIEKTMTIIDIT